MANRALAAKAERAARERREAAWLEYSKPFYMQPKPAVPDYDETLVRRIAAPAPKARRVMRPKAPTMSPYRAAWVASEYGLIRGKR